jgi:hypothetical protein
MLSLFSEAVGKELEALKEELGVPAYSVAPNDLLRFLCFGGMSRFNLS